MREVDTPRVSVVIAAYNVAKHLPNAVNSVMQQDELSWEILIADDYSSDETVTVADELLKNDNRIRLLEATENGGPSSARNRAIAAARGKWIAILDADDTWKPHRLRRMLDIAESEECHIIADNYLRYDEFLRQEVGPIFREFQGYSTIDVARLIRSEHPLGRVRYGLLKPIILRSFIQQNNIHYAEHIRYAEDFLLFSRILLQGGKGLLVGEPMYVYTLPRSSSNSEASTGSRTIPDLNNRVAIADELLHQYAPQSTSRYRQELLSYKAWMSAFSHGQKVHQDWKDGRRIGALFGILSKPIPTLYYALTTPFGKTIRAKITKAIMRHNSTPSAP